MATIDYYLFPLSPFSYLAGLRLEEVAARHGATIAYKPVELFRIFAETGTAPPKDRPECRKRYRMQDIARVARFEGLPINLQPAFWPANAVPASAAIIAAQNSGANGDPGQLVHNILKACWAEDRDIADDAVLRDCLTAAGFEADIAGRGLLEAVEILQRNTDEALKRWVFGAPTYVVGDEVFWGQDRLPHLDAHLASLA